MNWWHYLLLANLYLALFYGFYLLLLRKETYFMLNRIYLVSAAVLSFLIPLIQSEWVKNLFITQKVQQTIYYIDPGFVYQISSKAESGFTISQFFTAVYWIMVMLLLARLIYRFILLNKFMQKEETGSAFSFFGTVKVDENLPQKETIEQHELVHVAQLHSADVLLFEVLAILNWFNPVIYFYRKAIKHIHEFIADRDAISFGIDKSDYALLLLSQSFGVQPNTLTNNFFNQSLLKQRIMMLHQNPSRRSALLKYGLSAPLFVAMLILTSATVSEQKTIKIISDKISSDATVKEVAKEITKPKIVLPKPPASFSNTISITSVLKGKVVNLNGVPLAGVKITYIKKNITVTSDQEGNFQISDYTEGDPVNFSYKPDSNYVFVKAFGNVQNRVQIVVLQGSKPTSNVTVTDVKLDNNQSGVVSFAAVEKLPTFPGGDRAFSEYLSKAIRYPKEAKDAKTQGRVIVSFIVEKDGKLNNIKVLRDIGGGCGAEAIRVLSGSPDWNPGVQNGKPVRVAYTMPINFTLAGDNNKSSDSTKRIIAHGTSAPNGLHEILDTLKSNSSNTIVIGNTSVTNPIYVVDGKEINKDIMTTIDPNDIESISVYKGATATTKFGDKGKNGVVDIILKKGKKP